MNAPGYRNTNRKVAWAGLVSVALGLCALLILHFAYGPTPFDRQVWMEGENVTPPEESPRLRMADGLVESGKLIGMTPEQVDAFLGPQTKTAYFRPEYAYVYWLGDERGFIRIDSEWLVLRVAPNGTVSEARIVVD